MFSGLLPSGLEDHCLPSSPDFPEKRCELEGPSTERVLTDVCTRLFLNVLATDGGGVIS